MSVEALAKGVIEMQMTDIVDRVYQDFVNEVGKHNRTGEAQASISIMERRPDYALIGGRNWHLYHLDEGNAQSGAIIYAKNGRGMYLKDLGIRRASVKAYKGFHVARIVADRHR